MFRFVEKIERMAAAVGMAEGNLLDEATDIMDGKYEQAELRFVRDGEKKQAPRQRPRLHV